VRVENCCGCRHGVGQHFGCRFQNESNSNTPTGPFQKCFRSFFSRSANWLAVSGLTSVIHIVFRSRFEILRDGGSRGFQRKLRPATHDVKPAAGFKRGEAIVFGGVDQACSHGTCLPGGLQPAERCWLFAAPNNNSGHRLFSQGLSSPSFG